MEHGLGGRELRSRNEMGGGGETEDDAKRKDAVRFGWALILALKGGEDDPKGEETGPTGSRTVQEDRLTLCQNLVSVTASRSHAPQFLPIFNLPTSRTRLPPAPSRRSLCQSLYHFPLLPPSLPPPLCPSPRSSDGLPLRRALRRPLAASPLACTLSPVPIAPPPPRPRPRRHARPHGLHPRLALSARRPPAARRAHRAARKARRPRHVSGAARGRVETAA